MNAINPIDLQQLANRKLTGDRVAIVVGRESDLERHFGMIRPEFAGLPELCFLLAQTIVMIRRELDLSQNLKLFFQIVDEQNDVLCRHLTTRWLVAICDTFADHGTPIQQSNAMAIVTLVNTIKLAESERILERRGEANLRAYFVGWPHSLWDGVSSFQPCHGDMPRNMFARLQKTMKPTPQLEQIFQTVMVRLKQSDQLLARMSAHHQSGFWSPE